MLPPRRYVRREVQIPMTPLIDIVFLLLIYFLLTINYLVTDIVPLELPKAKTSLPQSPRAMMVSVNDIGEIFISGRHVAIAEMREEICAMVIQQPSMPLVIRADGKAELARVVEVLDKARGCGAVEISLATDSKGGWP